MFKQLLGIQLRYEKEEENVLQLKYEALRNNRNQRWAIPTPESESCLESTATK